MPRIIPDRDDLARMTPAQKAKVRRYIARVALELDNYAGELVDGKQAQRERDLVAWGEAIRQHARNLEAARPPEPPHLIESRRQTLLDATR
jgi:DNA-binding helix-hairpin-helix protein with protein kinase domain